MPHRIIFMGTPQFALPTLKTLIDNYNVVGVVTQPDRPRGRGRKPKPSPVKTLALEHNLNVLQPKSLRNGEAQAQLRSLQPHVIVVAAFGQILPPAVLDMPAAGCINVHASLLPRWRGAAPVAAAILAGDEKTGVTIMKMDPGLDTGPILSQRSTPIAPDDTRQSLSTRLANMGAELLHKTLPCWLDGTIQPQPQDDSLATLAPLIRKEQGRINWQEPAEAIARQVRAFHPWPGTFTLWQDAPLKILRAVATNQLPEKDALPGKVVASPDGVAVVTSAGLLRLIEVQPAGKRPMPADDFARGARDFVGSQFE